MFGYNKKCETQNLCFLFYLKNKQFEYCTYFITKRTFSPGLNRGGKIMQKSNRKKIIHLLNI